jgi:hypothetical protein
MKRLIGGVYIAVATMMLVGIPGITHASIYGYDGAGGSGMFAWDGDADVSTMNNNGCGVVNNVPTIDPNLCITTLVNVASLADIRIHLTGVVAGDFAELALLFTLPSLAACDVFLAQSLTCDTLDSLNGNQFAPQDSNGGQVDGSAAALLLPVLLVPAADGSLGLIPTTVTAADLAGAHIGLVFRTFGNPDFSLDISTARATVAEPSTLLLMGAGIASMVAARRRRSI